MKRLTKKQIEWMGKREAKLYAQVPIMAVTAPSKELDGLVVYDDAADGTYQFLIGGKPPPGAKETWPTRIAKRTLEIRTANLEGRRATRDGSRAETRKALRAALAEPEFHAALPTLGIILPIDVRDLSFLALEASVAAKLQGRKRLRG